MDCNASTTQLSIEPSPLDCGSHAVEELIRAPIPIPNISFSLASATTETYKDFITNLRKALPLTSKTVSGIPVLPATNINQSQRYVLVDLANYKNKTITIAIDRVNVYIVAYRAENQAYFLKDTSNDAKAELFKGIKQISLVFKGNYTDLERHAGNTSRENIELGFTELENSITNLFYFSPPPSNSVPRGFIVIIQSIAEAARFKYIENKISGHVHTKLRPDKKFLSLQNHWANLSRQIQIAETKGGNFETAVTIEIGPKQSVKIENVRHPIVKNDIGMLLNNSKENSALMKSMLMEELQYE